MNYWRSLSDEQKAASEADIAERSRLVTSIYGAERDRHGGYLSQLVMIYREQRGIPKPVELPTDSEIPSIDEQARLVRRGLSPSQERVLADVAAGGGIEQPDFAERYSLERFCDDAGWISQFALQELVEPPANPNDVQLTELGQRVAGLLAAD